MAYGWIAPAVGAALGGANALFSGGGLFGRGPRNRQVSAYSPEAQQGMNWLVQQGMQNADWGPIEERARQQFQQNTIPSIAERFTSLGEGSQGSSAFTSELGSAASDLESQLGALRSQYGLNQMQLGLQPQFENYMQPRTPGILEGMIGGAAQGGLGTWLSGLGGNTSSSSNGIGEITPRDKQLIMKLLQYLNKDKFFQGGRP